MTGHIFSFADEVVTSYSVSLLPRGLGVTRYEDAGFACDCLNGLSDNIPVNMPIFKSALTTLSRSSSDTMYAP